eukprot:CAMPEP_0171339986 /NCGR_PEP_ID=MMETSP0878-20121228/8279_1 /TAXON_ID=67004 /ORGANISM="Thalassiosira weissflogii, Strain CCMP1336" /LENGTH=69 /DNA_ID=CAMNT_0011841981 /DNA_START=864 /DNA_END=1073 /DNA_ORIENTATION=+
MKLGLDEVLDDSGQVLEFSEGYNDGALLEKPDGLFVGDVDILAVGDIDGKLDGLFDGCTMGSLFGWPEG